MDWHKGVKSAIFKKGNERFVPGHEDSHYSLSWKACATILELNHTFSRNQILSWVWSTVLDTRLASSPFTIYITRHKGTSEACRVAQFESIFPDDVGLIALQSSTWGCR